MTSRPTSHTRLGLSYSRPLFEAGPSADDKFPDGTVKTYLKHISNLVSTGAMTPDEAQVSTFNGTCEVIRRLEVSYSVQSASNQATTQAYVRTSIGANAHHAGVEYSRQNGLSFTEIKLSAYSTEAALADALQQFVTGSSDGVVGGAGAPYSVVQTRTEATRLVRELSLLKPQRVNVTHVWHRIWQNHLRSRLAALDVDGRGVMTVWQGRPDNPQVIPGGAGGGHVPNNRGMNAYRHWQSAIHNGSHVLVEIDRLDQNLVPYINYYLGGNFQMFANNWPEVGGNRIVPHLDFRNPARLTYSYLGTDIGEGVGFNTLDQGLANLPTGGAVNNQAFGGWDDSLARFALIKLARQLCIPEDCEAGMELALLDCFGENYHGVADTEESGMDRSHMGYSALMSRGRARVPGGSIACTILSQMREGQLNVTSTLDMVGYCLNVSSTIAVARMAIEPLVYGIQLAYRQCGVTPAILFPRVDFAQMHRLGVPIPPNNLAGRAHAYDGWCKGGEDQTPSPVMIMVGLVMHKICGARVPTALLLLDVGTLDPAIQTPLWGQLNLAECYTSVHPATLNDGVLTSGAQGLVGVPHALGDQFVEFNMQASGSGYYVRGMPNTSLSSEDGHVRFNGNSGIAMLGHSITLRRAQRFGGTNLSIMVSNVTDDATRLSVQGAVVEHERHERWAVTHEGDFVVALGDSPEFACLELYADFSILTSEDYSAFLSGDAGFRFSASNNGRRMLPGYMWAQFLAGPALGLGGGLSMFNAPKRRRIDTATLGVDTTTSE